MSTNAITTTRVGRLTAACLAVVLAAAALATALARSPAPTGSLLQTDAGDWSTSVVTTGLDYPWNLEHHGQRFCMTEKAGNIAIVEQGRLARYAVQTRERIVTEGGAGLLGMALAPDFATSGHAYLYHSYRLNGELANRIVQVRFDGKRWFETRALIAAIPGHRLYNGGRLGIGTDGYLYATTGWTGHPQRPQDLRSLAGKVLRMSMDGSVPASNPFPGSLVYSYGHRNPQGLTWSPAGDLFVTEHGESARDEINLVRPGRNYGWPVIEGNDRRPNMDIAWLNSGQDTWAPSGATFAGDALLVAALGQRSLLVVDPRTRSIRPLLRSEHRIRDVLMVGDDLYLITTNRSPRTSGPSKDALLKVSRTR